MRFFRRRRGAREAPGGAEAAAHPPEDGDLAPAASERREFGTLASLIDDVERRPRVPGALRVEETLAGRYVLDGFLGRGFTAAVFSAWDDGLDRPVALKVWAPVDASLARHADILRREGRQLARTQHAGIVRVYDVGTIGGTRPWLALEHLGRHTVHSLAVASAGRGLPIGRVLRMLKQVVEAVVHLHEVAGVYLVDVKPGNLAVDASTERVTLMDLGSCVDRGDLDTLFLGTPGYIAPEMLVREPASPKADVFAIGMTAYELLTGSNPLFDMHWGLSGRRVLGDHTVRQALEELEERPEDPERTWAMSYGAAQLEHMTAAYADVASYLRASRVREALSSVPVGLAGLIVDMCALEPSARPSAREAASRLEALDAPRRRRTPTAFLSYARADWHPHASRISYELERRRVRVWVDQSDIRVGERFWQGIERAIGDSDYHVVVVSSRSLASEAVAHELSVAVGKDRPCIVPIVVEAVPEDRLPAVLKDRQHLVVTDWDDEDVCTRAFDRLVAQMTDGARPSS